MASLVSPNPMGTEKGLEIMGNKVNLDFDVDNNNIQLLPIYQ